MTAEEFDTVGGEISSFEIDSSAFEGGLNIIDLLTEHTTILSSKGEARKAIKNNAVAINKVKIADFEMILNKDKLLLGKYMMVENGKKNKFLIKAK